MRMVEQLALLEEFERSAESRRKKLVEAQDEEQRFDQHRRQEDRREDKERERSADSTPATPEQIVRFQERLDHYDTATVQALMKNRQALDLAEDCGAEFRSNAFTYLTAARSSGPKMASMFTTKMALLSVGMLSIQARSAGVRRAGRRGAGTRAS